MSVGPLPDISGNITIVAPCVSCSGNSSSSPADATEYARPYRPLSELPVDAPDIAATSENFVLSITNTLWL